MNVSDIEKLPFEDESFDLMILDGVLDHISMEFGRKAMDEVKRVLKPEGYIYLTLCSTEDSEFGRGKRMEQNTYLLQESYEKGIIQHYFDLDEIRELLIGFKVFDIELYEERFPSVFTMDKSFTEF